MGFVPFWADSRPFCPPRTYRSRFRRCRPISQKRTFGTFLSAGAHRFLAGAKGPGMAQKVTFSHFSHFWGVRTDFLGSQGQESGKTADFPGSGGLNPGNWGLDGQDSRIRGQKNPELGPPSPELSDPRTQEPGTEKKVDPTPKKKSSPKKNRPAHITNPPLPTTIGHS